MIVTCLAVIMATLVVWVLAVRQKRLRDAKSQCQYQNKAHIDTPLVAHAITQKVPVSLMMSMLSAHTTHSLAAGSERRLPR